MAERGLMRFFTREREDSEQDDEARERLDAALHAHAQQLRPALPPTLTFLLEGGGSFWLHDAQPLALDEAVIEKRVVLVMRGLDYANGEESVNLTITYNGARLVGITEREVRDVILSPEARILAGELDVGGSGGFVHSFSLWAPTYLEFAVDFTAAELNRG
jgi:hypothetical protein